MEYFQRSMKPRKNAGLGLSKDWKILFSINLKMLNFKKLFVFVSHAQPINQMNIYLRNPGPLGWENVKFCNCYVYEYEVNISNDEMRGRYLDSFFTEQ